MATVAKWLTVWIQRFGKESQPRGTAWSWVTNVMLTSISVQTILVSRDTRLCATVEISSEGEFRLKLTRPRVILSQSANIAIMTNTVALFFSLGAYFFSFCTAHDAPTPRVRMARRSVSTSTSRALSLVPYVSQYTVNPTFFSPARRGKKLFYHTKLVSVGEVSTVNSMTLFVRPRIFAQVRSALTTGRL